MSNLCKCGCGQPTRIAPVNDRSKGWIKGRPLDYLRGHALTVYRASPDRFQPAGTKRLSTHGYVEVANGAGGWQYEHILMAENVIGRKLRYISPGHPDNEVVHHVDGNKQRNVHDNLLLCTHSYHTELHHRLERSDAWPEFPKIVRNIWGNKGRPAA